MRKLIISMNLSLDGYLSGPHGELDWHFESWDEEMGTRLLEQLDEADTILLGRNTYEAMSGYWPVRPCESDFPRQDLAIADRMNNYRKIVFTRSKTIPTWYNSIFTEAEPGKEIPRLKKKTGKNMILYGSGRLASAIIQSRLVDEYLLWVHPVILGNGRLLFNNIGERVHLKLLRSIPFKSGVVAFSLEVLHRMEFSGPGLNNSILT
jgi:dihydrofolate reductase